MRRYVVSAQRSGLNWLRFCVERFYGVRTPGRKMLLGEADHPDEAFVRSHHPLGTVKKGLAWRRIDPAETADDIVLLILRHPLETFVRAAERDYARFRAYPDNIHFFVRASSRRKAVFYYEDLVESPRALASAMDFLQLTPAAGMPRPTLELISAHWTEAAEQSKSIYDINQAKSGGAHTRTNPADFAFHQRKLSPREKDKVWQYLEDHLSSEEMRLLDRYHPGEIRRSVRGRMLKAIRTYLQPALRAR
jgi:hypothetical protein